MSIFYFLFSHFSISHIFPLASWTTIIGDLWFYLKCDLWFGVGPGGGEYVICYLNYQYVISSSRTNFNESLFHFLNSAIFRICYLWFPWCYSKVIALHGCGMQPLPTARTNLNVSCDQVFVIAQINAKNPKSMHAEIYLKCTYLPISHIVGLKNSQNNQF